MFMKESLSMAMFKGTERPYLQMVVPTKAIGQQVNHTGTAWKNCLKGRNTKDNSIMALEMDLENWLCKMVGCMKENFSKATWTDMAYSNGQMEMFTMVNGQKIKWKAKVSSNITIVNHTSVLSEKTQLTATGSTRSPLAPNTKALLIMDNSMDSPST